MMRSSHDTPDSLARSDQWDWRDDAACRGLATDMFFPSGKGAQAGAAVQEAKDCCHGCSVRLHCLTHAITFHEEQGVWGGLAENERRELVRQARRAAERQRDQEREQTGAHTTT